MGWLLTVFRDALGGRGLNAIQLIADSRIRIAALTHGGDEEGIEEANWVESP